MHTTNYLNTFIEVAEDSPAVEGEVPPSKAEKTVATIQFELISDHPYKYTSDDVVFSAHALKNDIPKSEWTEARSVFFSKGQPCMRSSPLTKRYGWGVHHDKNGKVAIYGVGSPDYKKHAKDKSLKQVKAMRSKKA